MEGRKLFGKYELGKLLGEGNFGKVYKSKNLRTQETVAIKMINKDEVKKHGMMEQVKKEISIMQVVKHPNIVELKEVMATKTNIYLVLEYVGGGDLYNKILQQGKFDENVARKFFQQIITAVDSCHSRGVCHRDLKLENILLDSNGENIKLCDFGLATFLNGGKEENNNSDVLLYTACGAFSYMAPEIVKRETYDGKKADIWSCGVILYILLAGRPPFQDENRMRMLWKIAVSKFEFPKGFLKEVADLVNKILVSDPKERIMMLDIMNNPWFKKGLSESYECDSGLFCPSPESSYNAFDFMLSMASGLDLSGLFESQKRKHGPLFLALCSTKDVLAKVEEVAEDMNYEARTEKVSRVVLKGGDVRKLVVGVEVFEVLPNVKVVEFSKRVGDTVEYSKLMNVVKPAMKDVVWNWQGDWSIARNNRRNFCPVWKSCWSFV